MRAACVAAASTGTVPLSLILRRPLEAVVSKDEARAQAPAKQSNAIAPPSGGREESRAKPIRYICA